MSETEAGRVVHVIDDDPAMRDSLQFLLETNELDVRLYESALVFLADPRRHQPGCIVTDVRMPGMTGLDLVRRLEAERLAQPVIMITGHADVPLAVAAMKAGVADFIEKPFDGDALLAAIGAALRHGADRQRAAAQRAEVLERLEALSGREREVLDGLVAGRANKIIADDLKISPRTVEVYRANVMTKMRAASLSELVRMTLIAGRE
jgi:two-component system, LuxR family, response regulator FixJ